MIDPQPPLLQPSAFDPPPAGAAVPMTFGQILKRIVNLLRSYWKTFVAVGLLPIVAVLVCDALFFAALAAAGVFRHAPAQPSPALMLFTFGPLSLLFFLVLFLIYGLYYGASSYLAVQIDHGRNVTAREALSHAWSKAGRYVWLMVLRSLIIAVPLVVCMIAVFGGAALLGFSQKGNQNAAALFFLVPLGILLYGGAIVYAVLASLRLSLAFCASVREDIPAREAIRRSGVLTAGAKGRIFLALLVIYAIGYALFLAFYILGLIAVVIASIAGVGNLHHATPLAYAGVAVIGVCVGAAVFVWALLLMAAYAIAFAVFYRDQCLRIDPRPAPLVHPGNADALNS